ncbi:MAG: MaoC/PaaZ C-terminal domain-containing protein [Pirellulales bacterium]
MSDCLYLEQLEPGAVWTSPSRTVTETDVVFFAGMTGDFDPLHVDHDYAAQSHYGKPIAHGLLGLSLMAGLSSTTPRLKNLALVRIESWDFHRPIYIGDTIHVVNVIEQITPRGRRSGEVVWNRKLMNSRGECVQSGRIITIVARRTFAPRNEVVATRISMDEVPQSHS